MGERQEFQPLTRSDRITVVLYRVGIVLSTAILVTLAALPTARSGLLADLLLYGLYVSGGMSVFFIHLYIGKFKVYLIYLYLFGLGCLGLLAYLGRGSLAGALAAQPAAALLLLPLSGCLGFVTAKEAFCFRLLEGYLLAMVLPAYLLLCGGGVLAGSAALWGLSLIALLLVLFTLRKVFMPLAYDIGDKTAYR